MEAAVWLALECFHRHVVRTARINIIGGATVGLRARKAQNELPHAMRRHPHARFNMYVLRLRAACFRGDYCIVSVMTTLVLIYRMTTS